ncbi:DEAD/DEAH box helicase [Pseudobowmanella zhangzhouensis]|uniref:DEAD/DEAH box helicase n=1 Tax=Pseudobowmanella zhangzhouensis TaxID=1537679 RepID=UPI00361EDE2B
MESFKAGRFRAIVNVGVLTTGFDAPNVDLIALLRGTKSTSLYIQMCGRGVRLFDGKQDTLVCDFADNILTHGPFDAPRVFSQRESTTVGKTPTKQCPDCDFACAIQLSTCPNCQYIFPRKEREVSHHDQAAKVSIMSSENSTQIAAISHIEACVYQKKGSPQCIRIDYMNSIFKVATEFVAPNGHDFAKRKAMQFWNALIPERIMPTDIATAVELLNLYGRYRVQSIEITTNTKYPQIVSRRLNNDARSA